VRFIRRKTISGVRGGMRDRRHRQEHKNEDTRKKGRRKEKKGEAGNWNIHTSSNGVHAAVTCM
jgi:hypothetical protein